MKEESKNKIMNDDDVFDLFSCVSFQAHRIRCTEGGVCGNLLLFVQDDQTVNSTNKSQYSVWLRARRVERFIFLERPTRLLSDNNKRRVYS